MSVSRFECGAQVDLQPLPCESQFLGSSVARISGVSNLPALAQVRRRMSEQGVRLACWAGHTLQPELAACFVVSQLELRASLSDPAAPDPASGAQSALRLFDTYGTADADLTLLAQQAGWGSRFRIDPCFAPEVCENMYRIWLDRSCRREIADQVLLAKLGAVVAGMTTVRFSKPVARIGLVSVTPQLQGHGIGRQMLFHVLRAAARAGCSELAVVTQMQNMAAVRLYQSAGFRPFEMLHWYHIRAQEQPA
ncbi:MAG: GNAT family N-acetyltransferase [Planctomyces sp.]